MDITKIQRIIRKAIKDYGIKAKYDDEILVSFLSVDMFREMSTPDALPTPPAPKPPARRGALAGDKP